MRALAFACAAGIALSSCTTTSKVDAQIQASLPKACEALDFAHLAFVTVSATGKISASLVAKEGAAYAGVQIICTDPSHTTITNGLVLVLQASTTVAAALKEAKANG